MRSLGIGYEVKSSLEKLGSDIDEQLRLPHCQIACRVSILSLSSVDNDILQIFTVGLRLRTGWLISLYTLNSDCKYSGSGSELSSLVDKLAWGCLFIF